MIHTRKNHSELSQKKIIHVDMDSFYASVEIARNPKLAKRPVAVAGNSEVRGVVTTCNYIARQFGVHSAMPSVTAKKLCPEIIFLPVDMNKYRLVSKEIHDIFKCYTKIIEPISLDEAYLDVSDSHYCEGDANKMAYQIRKKIFNDLNITASAGIAPNKFLAKLASEWKKPNGQFSISNEMIEDFIKKLPVRKIVGVGEKTEKKLKSFHIETCEDLQEKSLDELTDNFGKFGVSLYNLCRGIDKRCVEHNRGSKSLSVEDTYLSDLISVSECRREIKNIYLKLQKRLEEKKLQDKNIKSCFIKIKYNDFKVTTHQISSSNLDLNIYTSLLERALSKKKRPIRLLGVGVIFDNHQQLNLNIY